MTAVELPPWEMRPLAAERYARLGAQTEGDGTAGWYLAGFVEAKAAMYDPLEAAARDDDQGRSGWEVVADPATCPRPFLPWAAQLYGSSVPVENATATAPEALVVAERQRVLSHDGDTIGRTAAIVAAVQSTMTGMQRVKVRERYDPANPTVDARWHTTLTLRTSDTPDVAAAQRAANSVKPGGLIVHLIVSDYRDYDQSSADFPTYADRTAGNTSYDDTATP